ncbi:MAG: TIGR04211 family SH3 domain-containing protein [Gammaproteobacteria bacterium]
MTIKKPEPVIIQRLLILLFCLTGHASYAETLYVSDKLDIVMRTGKGNEFRIKRSLVSGTALEVLETTSDGYTLVTTRKGTEGWVISRYLMKQPAARNRLDNVEQQLTRLQKENNELKKSLSEIRQQKGGIDEERSNLNQLNTQLGKELEDLKRTAGNAVNLDQENKHLQTNMVSYERQIQTLQQENVGLRDRTGRDWFMVGAGVIILGIIIGLIIPRIRWRKRSSWDTL